MNRWESNPRLNICQANTLTKMYLQASLPYFHFKKRMCIGVLLACISVYYLHAWYPQKTEGGIRPPLTDSCELSHVGAGNWTQVLSKNNQCSLLLKHLSRPLSSEIAFLTDLDSRTYLDKMQTTCLHLSSSGITGKCHHTQPPRLAANLQPFSRLDNPVLLYSSSLLLRLVHAFNSQHSGDASIFEFKVSPV